jgi:hypothetical protein
MADPRTVQYCRWAEPTLFVVHPYWTAAEEFPWSCHADGCPRPVEDTEKCCACGRWQPKRIPDHSSLIRNP